MKAIKIILSAVVVIVLLLTAVYAYYGGFSKIEIKEESQGGEVFVFEEAVGDYSQTPDITNKIYYSLLNDFKIETTKGAGIFIDNPQNTDKNKLRSELGCLLDAPADSATMVKISEKFKIKALPEGKYLVTEFPFKGTMSVFVGIIKVYPAIMDYVEKNNYKQQPLTEIYDTPGEKTIYRMPLIKKN